jgi:uncharacterized OsmC-like protein
MTNTDIRAIHRPLRQRYQNEPEAARYTYHVRSSVEPGDALHASVESLSHPGLTFKLSVNERIGGSGAEPTPGDVMLAALAGCKALAVAMVASSIRVRVSSLQVDVWGELDHRGVLLMPGAARPGFEKVHCRVRLRVAGGTPDEQLDRLKFAGEVCCAMTDTLRNATPLETSYEVEREQATEPSFAV